MTTPIRILIADDHPIVGDSLSIMLDTVEGFEIAGIVTNGWQVLQRLETERVDVVLTDLHMPVLNGIDLSLKIQEQHPDVRVIILTMSEEAHSIREALQAGAYGYVMKSAERPELIQAIRTVAKGERFFSPKIVMILAQLPNPDNPTGKADIADNLPLTKREIEVIRLIAQGLSNADIAETLNIAAVTVKTHRQNLMKKVGVGTAIGLMRWALKHKLLDEEV
ncbi:MAG: DNA-binding response regulator [Cytophagales bacterium]|nr:MAG: DNA-binding response regulator [Cytophagales bacterium]